MKIKKQLQQWVNGISIHNTDRDECCPDFSCCNDKINTPKKVRKEFQKMYNTGDESLYMPYLFSFLGDTISKETDKKVYLAGKEK